MLDVFYRKSSTLWLFIFFQKEVKQVFEKYTFAHTIVLSGSCFLHNNGLRIKVVKTWIIITIISSTETWVLIKRISHAKSDQTWVDFKVNFIVINILVQIESHIIAEGMITTILWAAVDGIIFKIMLVFLHIYQIKIFYIALYKLTSFELVWSRIGFK